MGARRTVPTVMGLGLTRVRPLLWGTQEEARDYAERLAAEGHLCLLCDPEQSVHPVGSDDFQELCSAAAAKVKV